MQYHELQFPRAGEDAPSFWGELAYMKSVKWYEPVIMACLVIYRLLGYLIVRYRRNPARLLDKSIVSLRSLISTRSNIIENVQESEQYVMTFLFEGYNIHTNST